MEKSTLKRGCLFFLVAYVICVVAVYFIAGNQFQYKSVNSIETADGSVPVGEITSDFTIKQTFVPQTDNINKIALKFGTYSRDNNGLLKLQLINTTKNQILYSKDYSLHDIKDNVVLDMNISDPIQGIKGNNLALIITSDSIQKTNAVTVFYNNTAQKQNEQLYFNNQPVSGTLNFSVTGRQALWFGRYYFYIFLVLGVLLALYCFNLNTKFSKGKSSIGLNLINSYIRYKFLLNQLVSRDFKTKYKRSILGVLWSFLNPLLSMIVQYIVFSTIFRSNIPNFAVYLLIGIVFFNFFTESAGLGLLSIVGNAALITKVYVPKYIFPISRVLSSTINLLLSLLPLALVIIITGTPITLTILLLPFVLTCLLFFCMGMSMLLSCMMVFFRDTQFIWSVISMLWMYATPIFYPENIIPEKYKFIQTLNPMYHLISFCRTIVIQGISPLPEQYLFCIIGAVLPFALGVFAFRKAQDKFILYI